MICARFLSFTSVMSLKSPACGRSPLTPARSRELVVPVFAGFRRGSEAPISTSPSPAAPEGEAADAPTLPSASRSAKSYAVITGDTSYEERARIQAAYNAPENLRGGVIAALLVSKAGAEGLDWVYLQVIAADTLKRVLPPVTGAPAPSLERIVAFTETKTVWHTKSLI